MRVFVFSFKSRQLLDQYDLYAQCRFISINLSPAKNFFKNAIETVSFT